MDKGGLPIQFMSCFPLLLHSDALLSPCVVDCMQGRVALLGDSAHAMQPNLGQGMGAWPLRMVISWRAIWGLQLLPRRPQAVL